MCVKVLSANSPPSSPRPFGEVCGESPGGQVGRILSTPSGEQYGKLLGRLCGKLPGRLLALESDEQPGTLPGQRFSRPFSRLPVQPSVREFGKQTAQQTGQTICRSIQRVVRWVLCPTTLKAICPTSVGLMTVYAESRVAAGDARWTIGAGYELTEVVPSPFAVRDVLDKCLGTRRSPQMRSETRDLGHEPVTSGEHTGPPVPTIA